MSIIWIILGWILALLFSLATTSMLLLHNWPHALATFLVVLLCLPPVNTLLQNRFDFSLNPIVRGVLIVGLIFVFVRLLSGGTATSLYASPEVEAQFMAIYDQKMTEWPVPYEDVFVNTEYGKVHVIVSGPEDAPPMLLLHASGAASWSWKYNVGELSQSYRTYAIDLIGDAGKSSFTDLNHIMHTGEDQADLYRDLTEKLGIEKAFVVGASEGGFIGSNYTLHYPERVEKLALLGPMGYAGAGSAIARIAFTAFFPVKPIQEATFRWAFSDHPTLVNDFGEWFRLFMGSFNAMSKVAPYTLPAEQRQSLQVPVLFVFGEKDNLVGDPEAAKALVQDVPDVRVEIVDAGHLMGGELPEQVDGLILDFFAEE